MFDADGDETVPHREWLLEFGHAICEVRTMLKKQGREEVFVGAKVGESIGNIITRGNTLFIGDLYHCSRTLS